MKRLLGIALVLSMLGSSAVIAAPYGQDNRSYTHGNNNGAAIAGLSLFALAAVLASQNNNRTQYSQYNRGYDGDYNTQAYGRYDNGRDYETRSYDRYDSDRGYETRGYDQNRNGYQPGYGNRGRW